MGKGNSRAGNGEGWCGLKCVHGRIYTGNSIPGFAKQKVFRKNLSVITNPDMGAGSEILTQVKDHDLDVVEIPITARYDIGGTSSKHPVVHGIGVLNSSLGYYCFGCIIRMDISRLRMRCGYRCL